MISILKWREHSANMTIHSFNSYRIPTVFNIIIQYINLLSRSNKGSLKFYSGFRLPFDCNFRQLVDSSGFRKLGLYLVQHTKKTIRNFINGVTGKQPFLILSTTKPKWHCRS